MRKDISLDLGKATAFAPEATLGAFAARTTECNAALHNGTGRGSDFLGWLDYPLNYDKKEHELLKKTADYIRSNYDVLVVAGKPRARRGRPETDDDTAARSEA